jgi:hypothetical protein
MMQAAAKYLSPRLESKRQALAVLGRAKLLDLMVESDDDLEALADGGTLAGHTMDDIDSMTSRQAKSALREARAERVATDRLIETKNKTIDKLNTFTRSESNIARDLEERRQLDELHAKTWNVELNFMALANVVATIQAGANRPLRLRAQQAVQYLVSHLGAVIDDNAIDVDLGEQITERPAWLDPLDGVGAKSD